MWSVAIFLSHNGFIELWMLSSFFLRPYMMHMQLDMHTRAHFRDRFPFSSFTVLSCIGLAGRPRHILLSFSRLHCFGSSRRLIYSQKPCQICPTRSILLPGSNRQIIINKEFDRTKVWQRLIKSRRPVVEHLASLLLKLQEMWQKIWILKIVDFQSVSCFFVSLYWVFIGLMDKLWSFQKDQLMIVLRLCYLILWRQMCSTEGHSVVEHT